MSSTNRSEARKNHVSDYYVTPVNSILDFIMEFDNDFPELSFTGGGKVILDPCAGGDNLREMSYPAALLKFTPMQKARIITLDIREDSRADFRRDYLTAKMNTLPDVIITNPPFNLAQEIIEKALKDVKKDGLVIMLLRLNFFGSQKRLPFWDKFPPFATYVHSKRIAFTSNSATDSIEYMHCVWQSGYKTKFTQLRVI